MQPLSVLASAAYAEQEEFRQRTGLEKAVLVEHKKTDSQVGGLRVAPSGALGVGMGVLCGDAVRGEPGGIAAGQISRQAGRQHGQRGGCALAEFRDHLQPCCTTGEAAQLSRH